MISDKREGYTFEDDVEGQGVDDEMNKTIARSLVDT
jgi:hypothetical protein